MTTNLWINYIMRDVTNYIGVYSIDNLENPTSFPSYLIVNFSPSYLPGTHFVSIIFDKNRTCIYFDPLNLKFIPQKIENYMRKNVKNIYIIHYPVQNPFSGYCGFYCMLFILLHVNKIPLLKGILSFPYSSLQNDDRCVLVLCKLFKIYYLEQYIEDNYN